MQDAANNKTYCAVDIEATGFDPLTEEILEIGFVFFKLGESGFEVLEQWSQVFKPAKQVSSKILALTGISEKEIDAAPKLFEFHEFVQEKLSGAVLVGHSVGVDVRYLEANGFKLSGKYIDTLELVQFILPTRHSYNLENLMHYFSIGHENAHRALADALASMQLLEKLLATFSNFPAQVKDTVKAVTDGFGFLWHPLLSQNYPATIQLPLETPRERILGQTLQIQAETIVNFKIDANYRPVVAASILEQEGQFLFALPYKNEVLELWKQGYGTAVFAPEDSFAPKKFKKYLDQKQTNPEFTKFLAKVAVWEGTNWQTKTILDLNLSFAGNQFRTQISGLEEKLPPSDKVLICDHRTLLSMAEGLSGRRLVIEGLSEFETQLASRIGKRASWGNAARMLSSIYNPEMDLGERKFATEISDLLAATDLFFGLSVLTLESAFPGKQQVTFEELVTNAKAYRSIEKAAGNYSRKLENFSATQSTEALKNFASSLLSFFNDDKDRVKWIESGERFCVFNNLPLKIEKLAEDSLNVFQSVTFVDALGESLVTYYQKRLGLEVYKAVYADAPAISSTKIFISPKLIDPGNIMVGFEKNLPMALVMPSYKNIKDFYDSNFRTLKDSAAVFAEGYSGGTNKMFYNFGLTSNGLLILTSKLAARSARQGVKLKTLILSGLPEDPSGGVYSEAVKRYMAGQGVDASSLSVEGGLHKIIRLFYTPSLEAIYVYDEGGKLAHEYLKGLGFDNIAHI